MVCKYKIADKEVYKYVMPVINSNMYILIDDKKALVVDPNVSEEAAQLLKDKAIDHITILLTHEHYDHISGVNFCARVGNVML